MGAGAATQVGAAAQALGAELKAQSASRWDSVGSTRMNKQADCSCCSLSPMQQHCCGGRLGPPGVTGVVCASCKQASTRAKSNGWARVFAQGDALKKVRHNRASMSVGSMSVKETVVIEPGEARMWAHTCKKNRSYSNIRARDGDERGTGASRWVTVASGRIWGRSMVQWLHERTGGGIVFFSKCSKQTPEVLAAGQPRSRRAVQHPPR